MPLCPKATLIPASPAQGHWVVTSGARVSSLSCVAYGGTTEAGDLPSALSWPLVPPCPPLLFLLGGRALSHCARKSTGSPTRPDLLHTRLLPRGGPSQWPQPSLLTSSQGRADPAPLLLCSGPAPQGVPAGSLSLRWGRVLLREAVWDPLRQASPTWSRHAPAGRPQAPWRLPGVRLVCAPPHGAPASSWAEPCLGTTGVGLAPWGQERAVFEGWAWA